MRAPAGVRASDTQGVALDPQGVALGFVVLAFQAEDENANRQREQRWRRELGCQNGPRCSTMLPPPCADALRARRKVLPWAEKRDSEGAVVF